MLGRFALLLALALEVSAQDLRKRDEEASKLKKALERLEPSSGEADQRNFAIAYADVLRCSKTPICSDSFENAFGFHMLIKAIAQGSDLYKTAMLTSFSSFLNSSKSLRDSSWRIGYAKILADLSSTGESWIAGKKSGLDVRLAAMHSLISLIDNERKRYREFFGQVDLSVLIQAMNSTDPVLPLRTIKFLTKVIQEEVLGNWCYWSKYVTLGWCLSSNLVRIAYALESAPYFKKNETEIETAVSDLRCALGKMRLPFFDECVTTSANSSEPAKRPV